MEHEVFIPVPAETLREALRDHARVARCVPGLQQDADESARPLSGRLKVRVGGHTITYRGALTLTERAGAFTAKGEGAEVRGTGSAKLNVRIRLRETAGGTTVAFTATSTSEGRLSEMAPATSEATARRLLDRFTTALGASGGVGEDGSAAGAADAGGAAADAAGAGGLAVGAADEAGSERDVTASGATSGAEPGAAGAADSESPGVDAGAGGAAADEAGSDRDAAKPDAAAGAAAGQDGDVTASGAAESGDNGPDDDDSVAQTPDDSDSDADADADADGGESDADDEDSDIAASGEDPDVPDPGDFDAPVPPSALDASVEFGVTASGEGDFLVPLDPPAEAAHARRTMIGRSAEEVDHAPPRGRYAPERAPDAGGAGAALRWVAPAAALAIAGAVVVGRALRRRR
ncbi:SRPBCC domain-containing protein [Streptomyces sp. NPDC060366]|uniref:SRPBCC domain-containing protein n=1 Tax=Streptomyces sp. NPDC060366 TaxID=3347105 RepID=UPI003668773A